MKRFSALTIFLTFFLFIQTCSFANTQSGVCGSSANFAFDSKGGTLTISGSGEMSDFSKESVPWSGYSEKIRTLIIDEGIETIGDNSFKEMDALLNVSLPESLKEIGKNAFFGCERLNHVEISEGVYEIGDFSFAECENLVSISLPQSLLNIGNGAFSGCRRLESIEVPRGAEKIGEGAFEECAEITKIAISPKVSVIENNTFKNCKKLEKVIMPKSVIKIGDNAFEGCISIKKTEFSGSSGKWKKISIGKNNACLTNSEITYDNLSDFFPVMVILLVALLVFVLVKYVKISPVTMIKQMKKASEDKHKKREETKGFKRRDSMEALKKDVHFKKAAEMPERREIKENKWLKKGGNL